MTMKLSEAARQQLYLEAQDEISKAASKHIQRRILDDATVASMMAAGMLSASEAARVAGLSSSLPQPTLGVPISREEIDAGWANISTPPRTSQDIASVDHESYRQLEAAWRRKYENRPDYWLPHPQPPAPVTPAPRAQPYGVNPWNNPWLDPPAPVRPPAAVNPCPVPEALQPPAPPPPAPVVPAVPVPKPPLRRGRGLELDE